MFEAILFDFVDSDIQSLKWLHSHTGSTVCFDDFSETSVDEIRRFHRLVAEHQIDPLLEHEFRLKNTFMRHQMAWNNDYVSYYRDRLISTCTAYHGVEELLAGVKQKAKTGLITNAYDGKEQRQRIRNSGLEAYFDLTVVAGEIGIYKPDASIFLHAVNRPNVVPERCLYVGDSLAYDILGAKSAGMKTALVSKQSNVDGSVADYVVKGVDELQALLDRMVVSSLQRRACDGTDL